jgi:hypothetical protein
MHSMLSKVGLDEALLSEAHEPDFSDKEKNEIRT